MPRKEACPCRGCETDRHPGCHGTCEQYIAWKKDWDKQIEDSRRENTIKSFENEGKLRAIKLQGKDVGIL